MKNAVVEKYGFEHIATILFFRDCENHADKPAFLEGCFRAAMEMED